MYFINNLLSTSLTDFLLFLGAWILIIFWVYSEYKGSIFGVPFDIARIILWMLITTPVFFIFAKNGFGGFTFQNVMIIIGIEMAGIVFLIIKRKRFL